MDNDPQQFEMVAKTFHGLEEVLAEELRALGALNVEPGKRMVAFEGNLETLYRANMCCRTALRILKPICRFEARDADELYEMAKDYDWGSLLTPESTFAIDSVTNSEEFSHSRYVTYRVKDAIVDWFKDRFGPDTRPGVRLQDADVMINVHIADRRVTLSLDSSGESLHKRGYRVAQTEAPINEVLAAGIILKSGWRGDCPFVDPMCGSGTFLIEAALIGAGIMPGIYRKHFAFENWPDFDAELFDSIYNDESAERTPTARIIGADISPKAVDIARANIKQAGVTRYIDLQVKPIAQWEEAPADGILVTNPPYGERIHADDMEGLYRMLGTKLKHVFAGYHAWIIGYREEYFNKIGLSPSLRETIYNGALECQLREYVIFEGDYKSFRSEGGSIRHGGDAAEGQRPARRPQREPREDRRDDRRNDRYAPRKGRFAPAGRRRDGEEDDSERRGKSFDRKPFDRKRGFDPRDRRDRPDRFDRRDRRDEDEPHSDNPLARRRNEAALRSISGKRPELPPSDGPKVTMRPRKGWRKE